VSANSNPREAFFRALEQYRRGDLDGAQQICRELLDRAPSEVNTLRLSAQILQRRGQLGDAQRILERVTNLAPDYAHAWADLGRVRFEQGLYCEAREALRHAQRLNPRLAIVSRTLQELAHKIGESPESEAASASIAWQRALDEALIAARDRQSTGETSEAERICREVLEKDPLNNKASILLAEISLEAHQFARAETLCRSVLERVPESVPVWILLATSLMRQDKMEQAYASLLRAREIAPGAIPVQLSLATWHVQSNQHEQAVAIYHHILESTPDHAPTLTQLGTTLKTIGRSAESLGAYRRCTEVAPNSGEAWWSLSNLKTYRFSAEEITRMESALAAGDLTDQDQVYLHFALGKADEDGQRYDDAFSHYRAGNMIKRRMTRWDPRKNSEQTSDIIRVFNVEMIECLTGGGDPDPSPIFILGLPRSGSTLQEQILSSHSQVEGTRELPYIPWIARQLLPSASPYPEGMRELDRGQLQGIAQRYLRRASRHRVEGKPFFIDKLPNNFSYIGLIALCMPNAKIIHTRRDPMDNCFGCFKQLWAEGQHFSYDLEDLGAYYRDYHRLMQHWHLMFPGRILDVEYESVVRDIRGSVETLLAFCGLEWEDSCLRFHETDRAINTASSEQVRQPVYDSALDYWRNFAPWLEPLQTALGDLVGPHSAEFAAPR